jgi:allantoinase
MRDLDLVVRARRAVVGGALRPCSVGVRDGRIVAGAGYEAALDAAEVTDLAADEVLLPGLVDTHVHVNEPGRRAWLRGRPCPSSVDDEPAGRLIRRTEP